MQGKNSLYKQPTASFVSIVLYIIDIHWSSVLSERLLFHANSEIFSYIMARRSVNFQWDDEIRFVLDQHAGLGFDSASSLKQQFAGRHVAPLGHIILIPSQPVFALSA